MELNQLKCFQAVARTGSITQAASEMFITQSALSQSLNRLEESLGCPLFYHQAGKRIRLNENGIVFLRTVDKILEELEFGLTLVDESARMSDKKIMFGSAVSDLCDDFSGFFLTHPDIRLNHQLSTVSHLLERLRSDEIEFAIAPCPINRGGLTCRPLYVEEMLAVVGPQHPLFGKKTVLREELAGEDFICNYTEADRTFLHGMMFEHMNAKVSIILETNELETIQHYVDSGIGITFMPARVAAKRIRSGAMQLGQILRVTDYHSDVMTSITVRKDKVFSPLVQEFYDYCIETCVENDNNTKAYLEHFFDRA